MPEPTAPLNGPPFPGANGVTPPLFAPANPATQAPAGINPPQWYQGYLTYSGLILAAVGWISQQLGWHLSPDQVNGDVSFVAAHWDAVVTAAGLIAAAWGRLRQEWRYELDSHTKAQRHED